MPPLIGLVGTLVLNYLRHRRHQSTICSTCEQLGLGPRGFIVGWSALTGWLSYHYLERFWRKHD